MNSENKKVSARSYLPGVLVVLASIPFATGFTGFQQTRCPSGDKNPDVKLLLCKVQEEIFQCEKEARSVSLVSDSEENLKEMIDALSFMSKLCKLRKKDDCPIKDADVIKELANRKKWKKFKIEGTWKLEIFGPVYFDDSAAVLLKVFLHDRNHFDYVILKAQKLPSTWTINEKRTVLNVRGY